MNVKFEYISTKKPKWHIYHTNNYMGNGILTFKNNETGKQFQYADETQYDYSSYNDYVNFSDKVWNYLNTDKENMPFSEEEIKIINSKILEKREEIINFFKKNTATSSINHSEALHEEFKVKSVGAEPSVYRHSDTLPMGEAGKGESGISPLQDNIDTYKLEAEHQAATAMVEANMAEFHAEQQEIKAKQQQDREALIAEASRLTGRVEAFGFMSKVATVSHLMTLKKIKDSGIYKELPNIKTWEEYCKSIGYTRRHIDDQLESLNLLGSEFLETGFQFGLGYRDLKQLKKEIKAGNLEVKDAEVIIDGEVIPLDDKDELRDALDTLLKSKYKEIEEKDELLKIRENEITTIREIKDNEIARLQESNKNFFKDKQKAEKELKDILAVGFIKNIPIEENKDFTMIADVEREIEIVLNHLYVITHREYKEKQEDGTYKVINLEELSSFNKLKLGAVVIKAMNLFHNLHQELCSLGISDYFGDAFVDDDVIDAENNVVTPNMYLNNQGKEDE